MSKMDDLDGQLIAALRRDARASVTTLAGQLGVTRATVRNRIERLESSGEIAGYAVLLRNDLKLPAVRALTLMAVEGKAPERLIPVLRRVSGIEALHITNGQWDLIASIGTESLEALDEILKFVRRTDGIINSETHILLSSTHLKMPAKVENTRD